MKAAFKIFPYKDDSQPNTRWKVEGRTPDGKRVRRFFPTKVEAEMFRDRLNTETINTGFLGTGLSDAQRIEAAQCFAAIEARGKTLTEAVNHYLAFLDTTERSCTVSEAIVELLARKAAMGASPRYIVEMRHQLERVKETFGERKIAALNTKELDTWLIGRKLSPVSHANARRYLSILFNHCIARGVMKENPAERMDIPKKRAKPPGILTPEGMACLIELSRTHHPDMLASLLIQGFAGLRTIEVIRLDWKQVRLDRGLIEVTAENSKTAQRRLVSIEPNLAAWLREIGAPTSGKVAPACYYKCTFALRALMKKAKHAFPNNALRHSFASYHLASGQDAAKTSLQLGHKGAGMLFEHYRELVTPDDAAKWWGIGNPSPAVESVPSAK